MSARARILGTGKCLPDKVLTNAELEKMVDTSDEWIRTRTGIRERRIAAENEATSDLAVGAARLALKDAGVAASSLDFILTCTCTPDMVFPSVSCLVQSAIGAGRAGAMDVSAACSGFIYGLATAKSFIESGMARNVLLIGVDTLSKITNWNDRGTCVLFGDGAGAAVLTADPGGGGDSGVLSVYLGSDGSQARVLEVPGGGSRQPISQSVLDQRSHTIRMDGPEVYKLAVVRMVEAAEEALKLAGRTVQEVALVIPHQANLRIIESVARRLGLADGKVFVNVHRYGNMSAATTIIALDEAQKEGRLRRGDLVVLVAFGAGLTWGASVIRW